MAAAAVQGVRQIAKTADLDDIDAWWARVVEDIVALVAAGWAVARELAELFLPEHAAIEGRQVTPVPAVWNTEQVETALRVTGPVAFKQHVSAGGTAVSARVAMGNRLTGSVERLVLAGERDTVHATVDESDEIVGWRRVGDGDPCAWCAMLISRGAVYKSRASALGVVGRRGRKRRAGGRALGQGYHDNDGCTAEPLYEHEEEPAEVEELYDQWQSATEGKGGIDAMRAWREYWENRKPADEVEPAPSYAERVDSALIGKAARQSAPLSLLRTQRPRDPLSLTDDEVGALKRYQGSAFVYMNQLLREPDRVQAAEIHELVADTNAAFARSILPEDVVVYRGVAHPKDIWGDAAGFDMTGAEWTEKAYVSTTSDGGIAVNFSRSGNEERVIMTILVPKGVGAIEISGDDYEAELLLQPGLRMRVVSDSGPNPTGLRSLELEVVL